MTAYAAGGFLIPNAAGVYSFGHQQPVVRNPGGRVDILVRTVQHAPEYRLGRNGFGGPCISRATPGRTPLFQMLLRSRTFRS
ncbi:DUF1214 domain-containing protein [Nocardia yamanashiensis]|uniref:DUF1214 domain-containing protein n=1 Tax=Nocardia yamanashiensis TaxID=209247 RepID=UPI001E3A32C4|nr:DUF1214 domain-containing protein [Nocardia yamanashiensis]UGT45601.1 DUF1214 domain-containing protein [Nocardia yamanashiensis]